MFIPQVESDAVVAEPLHSDVPRHIGRPSPSTPSTATSRESWQRDQRQRINYCVNQRIPLPQMAVRAQAYGVCTLMISPMRVYVTRFGSWPAGVVSSIIRSTPASVSVRNSSNVAVPYRKLSLTAKL